MKDPSHGTEIEQSNGTKPLAISRTETGPNIPIRHGGCLEIKTEKKSPANASDSLLHLGPKVRWEVLTKAIERGGRGGQRRQRSTQRREGSDAHPLRSGRYPRKPEVIRKEGEGKRELNREEAGHGSKRGGDRRVETLRRPPESKANEGLTSKRRTVGERRKERIHSLTSLYF
ncbi:hypothetical protein HA466_0210070 [Hirschfeldia incana]|nr:hypothetical protein HA466_0210070 [Hirschfeldia incana]